MDNPYPEERPFQSVKAAKDAKTFWVVLGTPKTYNPFFRHATYESADEEATFLSQCNPKKAFHILECVKTIRPARRKIVR